MFECLKSSHLVTAVAIAAAATAAAAAAAAMLRDVVLCGIARFRRDCDPAALHCLVQSESEEFGNVWNRPIGCLILIFEMWSQRQCWFCE